MTFTRLLAVALMVSSTLTFAQLQQQSRVLASSTSSADKDQTSWCAYPRRARVSNGWRIIPDRPVDLSLGQDPLSRIAVNQYKADRYEMNKYAEIFLPYRILAGGLLPGQQEDSDTTCYSIRSYVVARDAKDSDSTHPAGYSTCQPSERYRVKSAEIRVESGDK